MTTGPTVVVLDPRWPFSIAAAHACTDVDTAAELVVELRRQYPTGTVHVLYPASGHCTSFSPPAFP